MTDAPSTGDAEPTDVLRAKYYDYCSARVAEVLLDLPPDEIFVRAQEAAASRSLPGDLDYDRMVRLATEQISGEIGLPTFDQWLEAYRADPEDVGRALLGLWRDRS